MFHWPPQGTRKFCQFCSGDRRWKRLPSALTQFGYRLVVGSRKDVFAAWKDTHKVAMCSPKNLHLLHNLLADGLLVPLLDDFQRVLLQRCPVRGYQLANSLFYPSTHAHKKRCTCSLTKPHSRGFDWPQSGCSVMHEPHQPCQSCGAALCTLFPRSRSPEEAAAAPSPPASHLRVV